MAGSSLKNQPPPSSPADFLQLIYGQGRFLRPPHIELLNDCLVCLEKRSAPVSLIRKLGYDIEGEPEDEVVFNRLVVQEPPRHGKSEMVSKYLPAWYVGTFPDKRVMLSSLGKMRMT